MQSVHVTQAANQAAVERMNQQRKEKRGVQLSGTAFHVFSQGFAGGGSVDGWVGGWGGATQAIAGDSPEAGQK